MSSIENIVLSLKKHSAVAKNSANPAPAAQSWVGERSADHINLVRAGRANPASPKANLEESTESNPSIRRATSQNGRKGASDRT